MEKAFVVWEKAEYLPYPYGTAQAPVTMRSLLSFQGTEFCTMPKLMCFCATMHIYGKTEITPCCEYHIPKTVLRLSPECILHFPPEAPST